MVLLQYFKRKKVKQPIPNPNGPLSSSVLPSVISSTKVVLHQVRTLKPTQKFKFNSKAAEIGTNFTMS